MIIDHVNSNPKLNAKIQWGTLTDYFKAGPVGHEFILIRTKLSELIYFIQFEFCVWV